MSKMRSVKMIFLRDYYGFTGLNLSAIAVEHRRLSSHHIALS